ncbi:MAG TPA: hypothetical protein VJ203_12030 [Bacteroidales bacterium]|nr:hypothetical protein [Bacteroidales bacterium]
MSFEHDIFMGYAPAAGQENQASTDWTLKFCDYLSILMHRLYSRKPVFLLHDDLRVRQSLLGESYEAAFSDTAVFVLILSPEYAKSASYMKEVDEICRTIYPSGNVESKHPRIFKILTSPIAAEEQPECLRNELVYDFFEINRYNKKPVRFDLNGSGGPEIRFWSKLVDLAYDISDVLHDLNQEKIGHQVVADRPAVFLAETTFDQTENRDMLKRELQHLGFRVLPQVQIPDDAVKSRAAIEEALDESIIAVHLMGAWHGDFIKNSKYSSIDFQIKTVKEYITSKEITRKPNQVIWIPNDIKPTDQRQALYLKRLKRDEAQQHTEIIETPFEVFKTILNARLNEITNPQIIPQAEKNKLYFIYEKSGLNKIGGYFEQIRSKGFEIIESHDDSRDFYPISRHINNLLIADAVLIYKGDSTMEWLNSKIRDLVKAPGYGKSKSFRAVEIISMQKTADKSLLFLKNVPVNWDEELNANVINHFLVQLAKK